MQDEQNQDTVESPALPGDVRFERQDVQAVGDPAAASTDAEAGTAEAAEPAEPEAAAGGATTTPEFADPVSPGGESPADAQQRAEAEVEGSPIGPIVGAFVGAFVLAKLIGRFGGGDD